MNWWQLTLFYVGTGTTAYWLGRLVASLLCPFTKIGKELKQAKVEHSDALQLKLDGDELQRKQAERRNGESLVGAERVDVTIAKTGESPAFIPKSLIPKPMTQEERDEFRRAWRKQEGLG